MPTKGDPKITTSASPTDVNANESVIETMGVRRLTGRMSRLFGAILADFEYVDSGSLDVLLYCADDLAAHTPGDVDVDRTR